MAHSITIELFSASACNRCGEAKKRVQAIVEEFGEDAVLYRELDVLEELDYAVSLGVLTTPAIAINGELVFTAIPSLKRMRDELQKRLAGP
ncbi:thioredoxin family protein [Dasania marina]|uniref:thioredoxin family protein n=1 Tax=Dasania marina TaxID=471499 RepID=UPI0030D92AD5|tara:strand:- start:6372 stop:6644 length:273 start_codon:yes stop_codon:yes gene_type:complete